MKKVMYASSILSIIMIWYSIYLWVDHPLLVPSILDILNAFLSLFKQEAFYQSVSLTFIRLLLSLTFSFSLSLILAYLSYKQEYFKAYLFPIITLFKTIPVVSIIILVFVIFDYSMAPYVITFLMVFPIFYQAILSGFKDMNPDLLDIYKIEKSSYWMGLKLVYIPLIQPYIILSLLQSLGLGLKVLVTAEFITQISSGIGRLIFDAKINLDYANVFAITIFLVILTASLELWIGKYQQKIIQK